MSAEQIDSSASAPPARELSQLLHGDDAEVPSTWRSLARSVAAAPKAAGALLALGVVLAVAFVFSGGAGPGEQFMARRHVDGGEVVLAASSGKFPYGFVTEKDCGVDFKIVNVVHNNLGNQGPGSGAEGIVYNCTESNHGKYMRNVLVKINAKSPYASTSAHKNGKHNDFGSIRVDSGKKVDLHVSIFSMQDEPLTVDFFRITFYDLDEGPHGTSQEYVLAEDEHPKSEMAKHSEVLTKHVHGDAEFLASHTGTGGDNPTNSKSLTELQEDRSVVLEYKNVHYLDTTIGSSDGHSPRNFAFALHSALACHNIKLAITTTMTTTTVTTTTVTTTTPPPAPFPWWIILAIIAILALFACCFMKRKQDALPAGYPVGSS